MGLGVTRTRLERLSDEKNRTLEKIEDLRSLAEEESRDLQDYEKEHVEKYRTRVTELDAEINILAEDIERSQGSRDVSRLLREDEDPKPSTGKPSESSSLIHRTFAEYARDELVSRYQQLASAASGGMADPAQVAEEARERVSRTLQNTLTSNIGGLWPTPHMAQIMDIIDASRPIVNSARRVNLDRGKLSYPVIATRPAVSKQSAEKTEAGTVGMVVNIATLTADTYLGGGDLSWQAINWSTPDALQLWFDLAAEAYARATENAAADALEDSAAGTVGTASGRLGTAGTEDFNAWNAATLAGLAQIYSQTSGRQSTDTLYLSADRFFGLAGLSSANNTFLSAVGNLDIGSMTGTWRGLRVVGSYAFDQNTAILGDSSALLVGETPGAPVELRAVEPSIGGMEVGIIGAFAAKVFDANRFVHLGTHL